MELSEKNIKNFWEKIDIKGDDDCWEWTAYKNKNGYGTLNINKKTYMSHRISWIIENGEIQKDNSYHGMCVCHKCDNPGCQNPKHLFLGTHKDNMDDKVNKNRQGKGIDLSCPGEKHGMHKLTEQEVLEIRQKYIPRIYTQKQLAEEYGVSQCEISKILNDKIWKHI